MSTVKVCYWVADEQEEEEGTTYEVDVPIRDFDIETFASEFAEAHHADGDGFDSISIKARVQNEERTLYELTVEAVPSLHFDASITATISEESSDGIEPRTPQWLRDEARRQAAELATGESETEDPEVSDAS